MSDLDLTQKICNFMGHGYDLISFKKTSVPQKNETSEIVSDIRELGWEPKIKIKDGLWSQCIFK